LIFIFFRGIGSTNQPDIYSIVKFHRFTSFHHGTLLTHLFWADRSCLIEGCWFGNESSTAKLWLLCISSFLGYTLVIWQFPMENHRFWCVVSSVLINYHRVHPHFIRFRHSDPAPPCPVSHQNFLHVQNLQSNLHFVLLFSIKSMLFGTWKWWENHIPWI
jgi:hypothetical protein